MNRLVLWLAKKWYLFFLKNCLLTWIKSLVKNELSLYSIEFKDKN